MPFVKGTSGNAKGRPKDTLHVKLVTAAQKLLLKLLTEEKKFIDKQQVQAACKVLQTYDTRTKSEVEVTNTSPLDIRIQSMLLESPDLVDKLQDGDV